MCPWSTMTLPNSRLCMRGVAGCFSHYCRILRNRAMPPINHQPLRTSLPQLIRGILLSTLSTPGNRCHPSSRHSLPRCSMRPSRGKIRLLHTTFRVQSRIGHLKPPGKGNMPKLTGLPRDCAGFGGSLHRGGASKEPVRSFMKKTARTLEACGGIAWSLTMTGMRRALCLMRSYPRAWNAHRIVWISPAAREHVDVSRHLSVYPEIPIHIDCYKHRVSTRWFCYDHACFTT